MKKTIVIVILVVYIASIAVVNFFGLAIKEFDGVEYVEEIKCNSITVMNENPKTYGEHQFPADKVPEDGIPEYWFNFIDGDYDKTPESLASNPNAVRIDYEVLPHTADGSKVDFIFEERNYVYFDEETRTFVFLKNNRSLVVTIVSTDGSNVKTTIEIKSRTFK